MNRFKKRPDWLKGFRGLRGLLALCIAWAGLIAIACAPGQSRQEAYFDQLSGRASVETHLGGEALTQTKSSMRRIRRDLGRFRETLVQLGRHGKSNGITRFERFVKPYLKTRVDPLIETPNSGGHPELRPFQAELLFSKAILLHEMGEQRALRSTISKLEGHFDTMTSMLVLYPTGEAVTLEQGVALLRHQTGVL